MIFLGSDHRGFALKQLFIERLSFKGQSYLDLGCAGEVSVDYPEYARRVAEKVAESTEDRGVLICATGIGMAIAANRVKNVRAALVHDLYTAKMSRRHNDSNILVVGSGVVGTDLAVAILDAWLDEAFEGGRHQARLNEIDHR